ncbi:9320_t:CDS:2, partial [Ambispora leptoticha]
YKKRVQAVIDEDQKLKVPIKFINEQNIFDYTVPGSESEIDTADSSAEEISESEYKIEEHLEDHSFLCWLIGYSKNKLSTINDEEIVDYGRVPRCLTKRSSERNEGSYRQGTIIYYHENLIKLHFTPWTNPRFDFGDNFIDPTIDVGKADIAFLQDNEYTVRCEVCYQQAELREVFDFQAG